METTPVDERLEIVRSWFPGKKVFWTGGGGGKMFLSIGSQLCTMCSKDQTPEEFNAALERAYPVTAKRMAARKAASS